MSLQFSDTTNYKGLVQMYEKEIGANLTDISGNTTKLKEFTADVNTALDDFTYLAIQSSGTWQFDDSNQTDYPIIKANLVDGQRDYPFTTDDNSTLILDVHKVFVLSSATATLYDEIYPVDELNSPNDITAESTSEGVPYQYGKLANALFLDPTPSYNATLGLKMMISREASYFASTDTTKKAGVPGLFHAYFYLKPAMNFARRKNLSNYRLLQEQVLKMEKDIKNYYGMRERDVKKIMTPKKINYI